MSSSKDQNVSSLGQYRPDMNDPEQMEAYYKNQQEMVPIMDAKRKQANKSLADSHHYALYAEGHPDREAKIQQAEAKRNKITARLKPITEDRKGKLIPIGRLVPTRSKDNTEQSEAEQAESSTSAYEQADTERDMITATPEPMTEESKDDTEQSVAEQAESSTPTAEQAGAERKTIKAIIKPITEDRKGKLIPIGRLISKGPTDGSSS